MMEVRENITWLIGGGCEVQGNFTIKFLKRNQGVILEGQVL